MSIHLAVLAELDPASVRWKTAEKSFINACIRTRAVTPSGCGVSDQVFVYTPSGEVACSVSPLRCAFTVTVLPRHVIAIVVSVESTVRTTAAGPIGKVGIVPTQMPAKRVCLEVRCCWTEFAAASLGSDFDFGLGNGFRFGFADCSCGGVGLDSSEIGAGR